MSGAPTLPPGLAWLLALPLALGLAAVVAAARPPVRQATGGYTAGSDSAGGDLAGESSAFHETAIFPLDGTGYSDPFKIAAGAPGEAWFTLPAEGALGRLTVTATTVYTFDIFPLPATDGQPYDLVYTPGTIWLTELTGNRVTAFDIAAETFISYTLPFADSLPSGIARAPDGKIWIAERNGDRIASLDPANPAGTLTHYQYATSPGNKFEDIAVAPNGYVWVTAPALSRVVFFNPGTARFNPIAVNEGPGTQPVPPAAVAVDAGSDPWVTAPDLGRLGKFTTGTLSIWLWFDMPYANAAPAAMAHRSAPGVEEYWVLDAQLPRLTRMRFEGGIRQVRLYYDLPVPGSLPSAVAVDDAGLAWVSDPGGELIATWVPPLFESFVYLPVTMK